MTQFFIPQWVQDEEAYYHQYYDVILNCIEERCRSLERWRLTKIVILDKDYKKLS